MKNFEIRERWDSIPKRCKGVHCVDLGESFPTSIYSQNLASRSLFFSGKDRTNLLACLLASIQRRTSSPKFAEASKRYPPPIINLALVYVRFADRATSCRTSWKRRCRSGEFGPLVAPAAGSSAADEPEIVRDAAAPSSSPARSGLRRGLRKQLAALRPK